jgi:hypothetical protein
MSENLDPRVRKDILFGLKLGGGMIGAAVLLALARKQGLIDGELIVRANNVVIGLALAAFSNVLPKMYGPPPRSIQQATLKQAVGRFTSWAMTLGFLAWSALWVFAPPELAWRGSAAAVAAGVAIAIGYTVWKCATYSTSSGDGTGRRSS